MKNQPTPYETLVNYLPGMMVAAVDAHYRLVFVDGDEWRFLGIHKERVQGNAIEEVDGFSSRWKSLMVAYTRRTLAGEHLSYEIRHRQQVYRVNTLPLHDDPSGNSIHPDRQSPLRVSPDRLSPDRQSPLRVHPDRVHPDRVSPDRVHPDRVHPDRVLFVFTNITEQKRTEMEMLNALKKERELGELKSRFVSMASHEFRTPLSTILSSANLIARQNEPGKEAQRLKNVERIRSSVRNLVDILNGFLSLGRLEEGKVSVHPEDFDLVDYMETIGQELEHTRKPGQLIRIHAQPSAIAVRLDKQFVRNIFLNLVSNALKYSPEGKPVDITLKQDTATVEVRIADRGVGIPEDEHKHLFDLFFRARNATNIQGTGLGLPIVKKYIELMQGDIAVVSDLERGTTFTVTLPSEQVNPEAP